MVKSMRSDLSFVKEFEKRVVKIENKLSTCTETIERNYNVQKEALLNTKEMLMKKFDVVKQLEEMIKTIKTTSDTYMELNDKFQVRVDKALMDQEKTITAFSRKLEDTIDANHTKQQATKSLVHGQNQELRDLNKKIETFNEEIKSKFD